ncbi:MAG: DNA translocase FtsK 4TM domain-containing protein, partial [Methylobacter sp.]
MEEKTFRGLREIAVLGFFAVALFLLISLVTFSKEDAGWTHSGAVQSVTNACGVFGAWLADFTLSFFGLIAYLFPVIISWHGYLLYGKARPRQQKMTIALQWLGS